MTRRSFGQGARLASLLLLAIVANASAHAPAPALSTTPSPLNWDVPPFVLLTGFSGTGEADPVGEFTIVVRDLANQPIANAMVTIDLGGCSDVRLCADPHDPAAILQCSPGTVSKLSDASGAATFRLVGAAVATPGTPGTVHCVGVYADGVLGAQIPLAAFDLVGFDGVGAADAAAWLGDFFSGLNAERADFDGSGDVGALDLSAWLDVFFAAHSVQNCGPAHCSP